MNVYVTVPQGIQTAKQIRVEVCRDSLTIGLVGLPPYIGGEGLSGVVKPQESFWTFGALWGGWGLLCLLVPFLVWFIFMHCWWYVVAMTHQWCVSVIDSSSREIHIELCKAHVGETWQSVLVGHEVSTVEQQEDRKRLMLERFQAEHPGFDFSGAEFSGNVPDPQTFLQ